VKCVSLTSKKDKINRACSAITFSALLRLFLKEHFLPQGAGYPSYATALRVVPAQCLGYAAKKIMA